MLSPLQQFGLYGERWVSRKLNDLGYKVSMLPDFCHPACDLIIEGILPCEVKLARATTRKRKKSDGSWTAYRRWQWNVSAIQNGDKVLILIAQDYDSMLYPFIMPANVMEFRPHFQITSHPKKYTGLIAPFLNNWSVVKFLLSKRYKSRPDDERETWEVHHAHRS